MRPPPVEVTGAYCRGVRVVMMLVHVDNSKSRTFARAELASAVCKAYSFDLVRCLLAALLLVAASLKLPLVPGGFWQLLVHVLPIVLELSVAAILLSSFPPIYAWWIALGCFSTFVFVSAGKLFSHESNCGCFGIVATQPKYSLGISVVSLVLLLLTYRCAVLSSVWKGLSLLQIGLVFSLAISLVAVTGVFLTVPVRVEESPSSHPPEWIGKRLPFVASIDQGERLVDGNWIVVFHRDGCEACDQLVARISTEQWLVSESLHFALIRIASTDSLEELRSHPNSSDLWFHREIRTAESQFIPTPLVVGIQSGFVSSVCIAPGFKQLPDCIGKDKQ